MPLRAFDGEEELIAPFLSNDEWQSLKDRVRSGESKLTFPGCGREARLRVSQRGLQHFFHKKSDDSCAVDLHRETDEHRALKAEVALGCRDAGYVAQPEALGPDWRADVLACQGTTRVAFEVQWSRQTLELTLQRQQRYVREGIRGCWFFRSPPRELVAEYDPMSGLAARKDLPLFALRGTENDGFHAYLNGASYPVRTFVRALLERQIKFSSSIRAGLQQSVRLVFFPMKCWRCKTTAHVYSSRLSGSYVSSCGRPVDPSWDGWPGDTSLRPEVVAAAQEFLATPAAEHLRLGMIKSRYSRTMGASYMSFGCSSCDALFGDFHVSEEWLNVVYDQDQWSAELNTQVSLLNPAAIAEPHWCFPSQGAFCTS